MEQDNIYTEIGMPYLANNELLNDLVDCVYFYYEIPHAISLV